MEVYARKLTSSVIFASFGPVNVSFTFNFPGFMSALKSGSRKRNGLHMLSAKIQALLFLNQLHFQRTGRVCEEDTLMHCFGCTNFGSLSQEVGRSLYLYGPIQILQNRRTVKQDESYKYERMCSQEKGRRSGSKAAP